MSSTPHVLPQPFVHSDPPPELLTQGAEALLYRTCFLHPSNPSVLKYRPPKPYRHPTLDRRLTRHRILSESRTLVKCRREGISVPGVLGLDADGGAADGGGGGWMMMEFIDGRTVREVLQQRKQRMETLGNDYFERSNEVNNIMGKIGRMVGRLHEVGVVHGDLTTSNMMLRPMTPITVNGNSSDHDGTNEISLDGDIVLIDFGLAGQSVQDEDKAVDLYVLERAFGSTHPEAEDGFQEVLRAYGGSSKGAKIVMKRLEEVRIRGRIRSMV